MAKAGQRATSGKTSHKNGGFALEPEFAHLAGQLSVVSLGGWCGVKGVIRELGLDGPNLPFDWLRCSLDGVRHAIASDFKDFLSYDYTFSPPNKQPAVHRDYANDCADESVLPFRDIYVGWGHSFWHYDLLLEAERQKYARRILRFQQLRCSKCPGFTSPLLFVRAANCTSELAGIGDLHDLLQQQFGERAHLLVTLNHQPTQHAIVFKDRPRLLLHTLGISEHMDGLHGVKPLFRDALAAGLNWCLGELPVAPGTRRCPFADLHGAGIQDVDLGSDLSRQWLHVPQAGAKQLPEGTLNLSQAMACQRRGAEVRRNPFDGHLYEQSGLQQVCSGHWSAEEVQFWESECKTLVRKATPELSSGKEQVMLSASKSTPSGHCWRGQEHLAAPVDEAVLGAPPAGSRRSKTLPSDRREEGEGCRAQPVSAAPVKSMERRRNPYDGELYGLEELMEACSGHWTQADVTHCWSLNCVPVDEVGRPLDACGKLHAGLAGAGTPGLRGSVQVISLGSHCGLKHALIRMGLSGATYPFDWLRTTLRSVLKPFGQTLMGFWITKRYCLSTEGPELRLMKSSLPMFWHNICWDDRDLRSFQRRARRLLELRKASHQNGRLLFVRAASSGQELRYAGELASLLSQMFGEQAHLLVLLGGQPMARMFYFKDQPSLSVATLSSALRSDSGSEGVIPRYRDAILEVVRRVGKFGGGVVQSCCWDELVSVNGGFLTKRAGCCPCAFVPASMVASELVFDWDAPAASATSSGKKKAELSSGQQKAMPVALKKRKKGGTTTVDGTKASAPVAAGFAAPEPKLGATRTALPGGKKSKKSTKADDSNSPPLSQQSKKAAAGASKVLPAKASVAAAASASGTKREASTDKLKQKPKKLKKNRQEREAAALASKAAVGSDATDGQVDPSLYLGAFRQLHQILVTGKCPEPFETFDAAEAGLGKPLTTALVQQGYSAPTPIQAQAWPLALQGVDMIGVAKTGSGKTCGFLLPVLARLRLREKRPKPQLGDPVTPSALVLAPTRELAQQIAAEAEKFAVVAGARIVSIYGGVPKGDQIRQLCSGVDVLIATPGRLFDFSDGNPERSPGMSISLAAVSYLVLDEADRMLDMGFEKDIRAIVEQCPATGKPEEGGGAFGPLAGTARQTLFFTATWPKEVQRTAASLTSKGAIQVRIGQGTDGDKLTANKSVVQKVYVLKQIDKLSRLKSVLQKELGPGETAFVFAQTRKTCDFLEKELWDQREDLSIGTWCRTIHSHRAQHIRDATLETFRQLTAGKDNGRKGILVATDVAARGLDIPGVALVVVYDFQGGGLGADSGVESYVHRIGRTGRAGKTGKAFTFFTKDDAGAAQLVELLEGAGQKVPGDLRHLGEKDAVWRASRPPQA
ncbi:unnamed protein product [Polarella glacialis]|uniref:RNA helicase n=1 Tax=Polarella glacialis TaxID=89957 RepID=A0A813DI98_POLGL|nr:unnamed protein product [Polarella glacialis]